MNKNTFLNENERQQIIDCVKQVELTTSGEIVPLIATASSDYPRAQATGALILGLAVSIGVCLATGYEDMWTALALFVAAYTLAMAGLAMLPELRRVFVRSSELADAVEEAAMTAFFSHGLDHTRDKTGILIYVSAYERRVRILADEGINARVDTGTWDSVVADLTQAIRRDEAAEGLCAAVMRCGELVREKFPVRHDDTDELPNLIET